MALEVEVVGDRYAVAVSPPHCSDWRSLEPLTATQVLKALSALGCHSTDITDALYAADPHWTVAHDAEELRKRQERDG